MSHSMIHEWHELLKQREISVNHYSNHSMNDLLLPILSLWGWPYQKYLLSVFLNNPFFLSFSKGLFTREATKRGPRQFTYLFFIGLCHFSSIALERCSHWKRQAQNDKCLTLKPIIYLDKLSCLFLVATGGTKTQGTIAHRLSRLWRSFIEN